MTQFRIPFHAGTQQAKPSGFLASLPSGTRARKISAMASLLLAQAVTLSTTTGAFTPALAAGDTATGILITQLAPRKADWLHRLVRTYQ
jgi:hypothetical protein